MNQNLHNAEVFFQKLKEIKQKDSIEPVIEFLLSLNKQIDFTEIFSGKKLTNNKIFTLLNKRPEHFKTLLLYFNKINERNMFAEYLRQVNFNPKGKYYNDLLDFVISNKKLRDNTTSYFWGGYILKNFEEENNYLIPKILDLVKNKEFFIKTYDFHIFDALYNNKNKDNYQRKINLIKENNTININNFKDIHIPYIFETDKTTQEIKKNTEDYFNLFNIEKLNESEKFEIFKNTLKNILSKSSMLKKEYIDYFFTELMNKFKKLEIQDHNIFSLEMIITNYLEKLRYQLHLPLLFNDCEINILHKSRPGLFSYKDKELSHISKRKMRHIFLQETVIGANKNNIIELGQIFQHFKTDDMEYLFSLLSEKKDINQNIFFNEINKEEKSIKHFNNYLNNSKNINFFSNFYHFIIKQKNQNDSAILSLIEKIEIYSESELKNALRQIPYYNLQKKQDFYNIILNLNFKLWDLFIKEEIKDTKSNTKNIFFISDYLIKNKKTTNEQKFNYLNNILINISSKDNNIKDEKIIENQKYIEENITFLEKEILLSNYSLTNNKIIKNKKRI